MYDEFDTGMIIEDGKRYLAPTYTRPEWVIARGEGAYLYDTTGKRYLDFCAGIAVMSLGHSDPDWVKAVTEQAQKLVHVSNLYHTAPAIELARLLVESSFADRVFFANSGAEANEGAIKFARKYAYSQGHSDKVNIVHFSGAFHGRTMGALALTPRERYQQPFRPLMPAAVLGEFNSIELAELLIDRHTCAVIVEPIQGEGGIHLASAEFLQTLRTLCDQHDALLIFDEVQCGVGRTGTLWAHQQYSVTPDLMTTAKPLAGGLPIGAVLMTERVAATIEPGDHGSTFAGSPLVTSAALAVLNKVSDPAFLARVTQLGDYLRQQLQAKIPSHLVVEIRGRGLIVGLELTLGVAPLIPLAAEKGLLIISAGPNIVRFVPPLIVDEGQIETAVDTVVECLQLL